MTSTTAMPDNARRYALLPWLAYPLLAVAGALTHRQIFPLLALMSLMTAVMWSRLRARRVTAWLLWFALAAGMAWLSLLGFAGLLLEAVPVLINALLAYGFGRTLCTDEPLVARIIVAVEGEDRLAMAGVSRYARQLTGFWTFLLATQALVLAVLLMCAQHSGLLAQLHMTSPLPIPDHWAALWLHAGGYILLGSVFALEYGYRRWHLRHLEHTSLRDIVTRVSRHWPQLLRSHGTPAA
ncbi:xanthomonadin biosynthesis protein [Rhodanobacter sp. L36]|uniref:xanthomonadin biosynthesis protein n=1 Tax=Rhodanobacter sp. L36 TaxID=1747221 RepID=UPI00131BD3E2|nr:xanthomonadin biosynthesis protein [Rhodanobacter sp. L36]